jgi:hypothetical protein
MFLTAGIPEQWKTGIVIAIFKKCDKQVPENFRVITLLKYFIESYN